VPGNEFARARPSTSVVVSRWPVVDTQLRVAGYRVDYAVLSATGLTVPSESSALQLFDDALSVVGLDQLVGPRVAHLPISRELLLALGVPPVHPDRVLLRLAHAEALEPAVGEILKRLTSRGYALELGALPSPDFDLGLLEVFGSVEIDLASWTEAEIEAALPRILARHARPIASNVCEHAQYEWARAQGFELFDGAFYAKPRLHEVRSVGVDRVGLASLVALQASGASVEESVRIIEQDVGLSLKLLRYLNSAYLARRGTVSSIRQAVMMLGTSGVARWALLIALTTGPGTPRELSLIALTRAKLCQSLGDGHADADRDQLFTVGLLSLADALLDVSLETVLDELPLTDETRAALLGHEGVSGTILNAVISHERGEFDLPTLRAESETLLERYRDALRWADSTIASVN
jgi:EAL and modified HD-GYP domain-containing signal transduction protein